MSAWFIGLQQAATPHLVGRKPTWMDSAENKHLHPTRRGRSRTTRSCISSSNVDGKTTPTQQQRSLRQMTWTSSSSPRHYPQHPHSTDEVPKASEGEVTCSRSELIRNDHPWHPPETNGAGTGLCFLSEDLPPLGDDHH